MVFYLKLLIKKNLKVTSILILLLFFQFASVFAENNASQSNSSDLERSDSENSDLEKSSPEITSTVLPITITATPLSGVAPLSVQFISAVAGKPPFVYSWDFNNDSFPDSSLQNPSYKFEVASQQPVRLSVTDAEGNSGTQTIIISVQNYDSGLNLTSYFPISVQKGQNQITFLLTNNGKESLRDVSAKILADGIQQASSTTISLIRPGDQDSITINALFLKSGENSGLLKVEDKKFPLTFIVKEPTSYNSSELEASFQQIRQALSKQEAIYSEKKAEGYLVSEVYDVIKTAQKQVQDAQQQLLTKKYAETKLAIDLANTTIMDVTQTLQNAFKQKQSPLIWLKENAVAITAIVAASGTLSGILIKVKNKASKLGENVKLKITPAARKREEEVTEEAVGKAEIEKEKRV